MISNGKQLKLDAFPDWYEPQFEASKNWMHLEIGRWKTEKNDNF